MPQIMVPLILSFSLSLSSLILSHLSLILSLAHYLSPLSFSLSIDDDSLDTVHEEPMTSPSLPLVHDFTYDLSTLSLKVDIPSDVAW